MFNSQLSSMVTTVAKQFEDIEQKLLKLGNQQFNGKNTETKNAEIISINESNLVNTELICEICTKEFKSRVNIVNHDKKFHMVKGTNIYKCDNCEEKHNTKSKLKYHITKGHITCTICLKIFPTIQSLNIHITAVHDKLKTKHHIEEEPSLRNKKVSKF